MWLCACALSGLGLLPSSARCHRPLLSQEPGGDSIDRSPQDGSLAPEPLLIGLLPSATLSDWSILARVLPARWL